MPYHAVMHVAPPENEALARDRSWMWAALALLVFVQVLVASYFMRFAVIDDAFIVYRYAENLVQGHGLVFNIGERVEGYTCFLWVVLLCLPLALGLDPLIASRVLGAGFLALTLVLSTYLFRVDRHRPMWSRLIAPALLAVNGAVALWSVHGLETALFTALLTIAVRADIREHGGTEFLSGWSAIWYALAALARPEAGLMFGASCVFWAVTDRKRLASSPFWKHVLRFILVAVPFEIWRYAYYGDLLPNTFYSKVGLSLPLVSRGLVYVLRFFANPGGFVYLALVPAFITARRDRRVAFLIWMVTAFHSVVVLEGGDAFPAWRFLVPIVPILFFVVQEGVWEMVTRLATKCSHARAMCACFALVFIAAAGVNVRFSFEEADKQRRSAEEFTSSMKSVGLFLKKHLPPDARIALNPAGAIPYYSRLYAYDMLGLTDRHIGRATVAEMGSGLAGHEKGDGAYILDQRPEVILFGNVSIVPLGPIEFRDMRWTTLLKSEIEISRDPRTLKLYVLDQAPLGDGRYLVFLRRNDVVLGNNEPL